jgi:lysophospholipase L1-like esterase
MKYIIGIVLILLIISSFTKKETNTMQLNKTDCILAFGDSLTYGFGADPGESYPELLSQYTGLKVINAGVNGDTSEEGLRRLAPLLKDPSIKMMILFFGGNDIMQKKPMTALQNNLKTMIQMAKEKKVDVLLVSVPNITLFGLSPLDLYKEVAEEEKIPLLSGMLADILSQPSLKSDQIHPNAKGYEKMAQKIYESLQQYYNLAS